MAHSIDHLKKELLKLRITTRNWDDRQIIDRAHLEGIITDQECCDMLDNAPADYQAAELGQALAQAQQIKPQPKNEEKPVTQAQPQANPELFAQMAQLFAQMMPAPQVQIDETKIIDLIKKHADKPRELLIKQVDKQDAKNIGITHPAFERVLRFTQHGIDCFLTGPTGSGKSTTAKKVAEALNLPFFQMGAIMSKFEALGSDNPAQGYRPSVVRKWLESEKGGLICFDEIDASNPNAPTSIMAIFDQDGELTFPDGKTFKRTPNHRIIITGNTTGFGANAEYNSRFKLDNAFLTRFVTIQHDYDPQLENHLGGKVVAEYARKFRATLEEKRLRGAIIAPRSIQYAGAIFNDDQITKSEKKAMLQDIFKQGMTDTDYKAVTDKIGELV